MKSFIFNKIIAALLIASIVTSTGAFTFLAFPEKAEAIAVVDAGNIAQSTITAANTTVSSFSNMSLQLKAFVLDTLATTLAKQLIRQITASVVNWINTGFEGSPSFIENPASFFLDVADQISGEFLKQYGGPLTALCSPFSIDIRLQLAFKYHPKIQTKYACTLGTVIKNAKNANISVNGQSMNGFLRGDFNQGGLPAFVTLTTQPQNNPYGAYLEADSELGIRVANAQTNKKMEIGAGSGFLSWRDRSCMKQVKQNQATIKAAEGDSTGETEEGRAAWERIDAAGGDLAKTQPTTSEDCPVRTPGSLIQGTVLSHVTGPVIELELVDSINQIVNALAAQLVNKVLQTGLRAVSGGGPSDTGAYINQIQYEDNAHNAAQTTDMRTSLQRQTQPYITNAIQFRQWLRQSLDILNGIKADYERAKACYQQKIGGPWEGTAVSRINQIESALNTNITPKITSINAKIAHADTKYDELVAIDDKAIAARTPEELEPPTQAFSKLLQEQNLISPRDIGSAQDEYSAIQESSTAWKQDAAQKYLDCQSLGNPYGSSTLR